MYIIYNGLLVYWRMVCTRRISSMLMVGFLAIAIGGPLLSPKHVALLWAMVFLLENTSRDIWWTPWNWPFRVDFSEHLPISCWILSPLNHHSSLFAPRKCHTIFQGPTFRNQQECQKHPRIGNFWILSYRGTLVPYVWPYDAVILP